MAKYTYLSDSVGAFFEDRCVFNSDAEIPKPTLFEAYRVFCSEKHVPTENKRAFGRILKKRCYGRMRERQNNWTGITLGKVKRRKQ